ncbi:MAG: DNA mismatch repair protein MutS [Agathobacter sp.]|nr:DNA mismatch repair protein MutS [Agathobacter sp.]
MNSNQQIEFDKIKELWAELALTDDAKEKIKDTTWCMSETELRMLLKETTDARDMIEKLGTPPLQNVSDMKEVIQIVEKGQCLTPFQLERVEKVLAAIRRLKDYMKRGKQYENSLAYYDENLEPLLDLSDEITSKIRNGAVDDYASKELLQIRGNIIKCEEQMKLKAEQVMRAKKECMAENFYTTRNGRICLPIKKEYKLKITGSVIDKSSTGSTLFIEPTSVAKYYDELQLLKIEEENEEFQILYTLSTMILSEATVLTQNLSMIERLDFVFSKGKLSIDMDATEPVINTERRIQMTDVRHPLMDREVAVPLQFQMDDGIRGVIITGPNTGGKTIAIKTVMLNCIMAQCGLHVTCKQADICMNNTYLCDIGDGQNLSENLSTFSAHITNVLSVLKEANQDSFVIMDELGSGTDPTEGMGIAIAILEELRKSGAIFLVTTHYPEVKEYAKNTEGIINARMLFDKETLCPTYQMVIGEAGESCAFYIADRLGMPNEMLRVAIKAAYGEEAVDSYVFYNQEKNIQKKDSVKISKSKKSKKDTGLSVKYKIGDSVMVFPDKKIGIVCEPINEKGVLRIQLPNKKIWINNKRVKLHVAATELYPEDYDFSIVFETVENRKKRHEMDRKFTDAVIAYEKEE